VGSAQVFLQESQFSCISIFPSLLLAQL